MLTVDFERLRVAPGMCVLDAGCGQGRHSLELLRWGCATVAMDMEQDHLRHTRYLAATVLDQAVPQEAEPARAAQTHSQNHHSQGDQQSPIRSYPPAEGEGPVAKDSGFLALRGDTLRLPFEPGCFERIICAEVLEHVSDPALALAELRRVLKPGGVAALSVPTPFSEWVCRFASDEYFNSPGGHVRIFTPRRLVELVKAEGLHVVDVHFEHGFHTLYWWLRCVLGLNKAEHPLIRHAQKFLTYVLFSPPLQRAEGWFNHLLPKSMVLYVAKPG